MNEDLSLHAVEDSGRRDPREQDARAVLRRLFDEQRERVFFSRQLEVIHEADYFHWITNRAARELIADGVVRSEERPLATGGSVHLMWHRSYRYHQREAASVVQLVERYANPNIGAAIGLHGEGMVLEGFARKQFVMYGRSTRSFRDRSWILTEHDLDFIFERDEIAYGVEIKNTLGYMPHDELRTKIELCDELGVRPLFAVRMLPKTWINEVNEAGGFVLILKYQLYPWGHRELAREVNAKLGLPVDSPRALRDGTMQRFVRWHEERL